MSMHAILFSRLLKGINRINFADLTRTLVRGVEFAVRKMEQVATFLHIKCHFARVSNSQPTFLRARLQVFWLMHLIFY